VFPATFEIVVGVHDSFATGKIGFTPAKKKCNQKPFHIGKTKSVLPVFAAIFSMHSREHAD
jgi:hypothetical protein